MYDTETLAKSDHRGFAASVGLRPLRRAHWGCGGRPLRAEGQSEDQRRSVAGEAGRTPGPLTAPGRGSKVRAVAETSAPSSTANQPLPPSRPSPAASRPPWAGRTEVPACCSLASALPRGDSDGAWAKPPPNPAGAARPRATRWPKESQLPPPDPLTTGPRSARLRARPAVSAHPPRAPGATAVARLLGSRALLRPLWGPPPTACPPPATARCPPPRAGWRDCITWRGRGQEECAGSTRGAAPRGGALRPRGCWEAHFEGCDPWRQLGIVVRNMVLGMGGAKMPGAIPVREVGLGAGRRRLGSVVPGPLSGSPSFSSVKGKSRGKSSLHKTLADATKLSYYWVHRVGCVKLR